MVKTVQEEQGIHSEIGTAVRHSFVYGMGSMAIKGLGFLMVPFYTHYLRPADYGVLELLDLTMSLLSMFLNMGITAALLRSYVSAPSPEQKRQSVSTAFIFVALTGLVTFLISLPLIAPTSRMLFGPGVPPKYLLLSLSSFVLAYIANLPRTHLRALEASGKFVMVDVVALFLSLALNIYFIAGLKIGLVGILLSSLIVAGLQAVLLSIWTLSKVGFRFNRNLMGEMVAFGLPLILSNLAMYTLNFSDRFFLQHFRSLEMVGMYAVGYKFGFMINYLLVQPFYVMWQSRMFVIHGRVDHPRVFGQLFVLYSVLLIYAGLGMALLSPEIMHVMVDVRFQPGQAVIPIVAAAYVFYGIGYYVQLGMFLTSNTKMIGAVSAAAAVLNLGLNYILVLHFGMLGAAWATLLSFAGIAAGNYFYSQRVLRLPLALNRVGLALGVAGAWYLGLWLWTPASLPLAVSLKVALLLIFPVVLWKAGVFSAAERETLLAAKDSVLAMLGKRTALTKVVSA